MKRAGCFEHPALFDETTTKKRLLFHSRAQAIVKPDFLLQVRQRLLEEPVAAEMEPVTRSFQFPELPFSPPHVGPHPLLQGLFLY